MNRSAIAPVIWATPAPLTMFLFCSYIAVPVSAPGAPAPMRRRRRSLDKWIHARRDPSAGCAPAPVEDVRRNPDEIEPAKRRKGFRGEFSPAPRVGTHDTVLMSGNAPECPE